MQAIEWAVRRDWEAPRPDVGTQRIHCMAPGQLLSVVQ